MTAYADLMAFQRDTEALSMVANGEPMTITFFNGAKK